MSLLVYPLFAFGIAYIVGHAVITRPAREWLWRLDIAPVRWLVLLLECPACFGFWEGIVFGATGIAGFDLPPLTNALVLAFCTVTTNLILGRIAGVVRVVDGPEGGEGKAR